MSGITIQPFGQTLAGEQTQLFTLRNSAGLALSVTDYGARIVNLLVPNRNGDQVDVVLGVDQVSDYLTDGHYLGATIGRFANRIALGRFVLDGRSYRLSINDAPHSLHGANDDRADRSTRASTLHGKLPEPQTRQAGPVVPCVFRNLLGSSAFSRFSQPPEFPFHHPSP
jgi:galactose mutarotase-like enzyme